MTSNALATTSPDMGAIEQVLVAGDLSKLTAAQRVTYYNRVCESLGLNPLTRPFAYIVLNDKLTLYARKDATDQLRSRNQISVEVVSKETTDDLFVVVARARTPDGRVDEDMGAVDVKGLTGEKRGNALMKAMTKAKRRVTLSICGLGMADESDVETSPDAKPVTVDMQTGEIVGEAIQPPPPPPPDFGAMIDGAQTLEALAAVAAQISKAKPGNRTELQKKYLERSKALTGDQAAQ